MTAARPGFVPVGSGADGDVVRRGSEGALRLLRRVGAQAELHLRRATSDLRGHAIAAVEEIFLAQMTAGRAELECQFRVIV